MGRTHSHANKDSQTWTRQRLLLWGEHPAVLEWGRTEERPHCHCWQVFGSHLPCGCVVVWLCGRASVLCPFQMNLHPIESTMAPWPCHSLVCQLPTVLLVSSDTPTSSMSPSMKIAFSEVFPLLGSLRLLWDLLPQLNHFWVVLMCLCASSPLWNEGVSCTDLTGSLWVLVDYVRLQGKAEHRGPSYKPPSLLPQGHPTCISHSATFTPLCPCRLCLSHSCCSFHCY